MQQSIQPPKRRFLYCASPWRAFGEGIILGLLVLFIILFSGRKNVSPTTFTFLFILEGIASTAWGALRLRAGTKPYWRFHLIEIVFIALMSILQILFTVVFFLPYVTFQLENRGLQGSQLFTIWKTYNVLIMAALLLACNYVTYIGTRLMLHLWLFWDRLRRTQLQWAITHAHMMLAALCVAVPTLLFSLLFTIMNPNSSVPVVGTALPYIIVGIVLSIIAALAVMPPSAIFSFLVTRRTVQRLRALTSATGALRFYNYSVRVQVVGEDEVAQLQSDFNAMADNLQRVMGELQQERDTIRALLQSRRELVANVSHDLRTPVATMRGYLETTLMHWDERSREDIHHDLQVMENEVTHLQRLVEDLFSLARADVGKLSLRCEPARVDSIVERIVEARSPLAWQTGKITMAADIPEGLPEAMVDSTRLEQILQNLLHNAVRHTAPGGIVAAVMRSEPGFIVIQIKDTGEGIPPDDLPHIWERFYQAKNSRSATGGGGSGLGLSLVKEFTEAMGGSVEVESVLGEGSCFTIRLPSVLPSSNRDTRPGGIVESADYSEQLPVRPGGVVTRI